MGLRSALREEVVAGVVPSWSKYNTIFVEQLKSRWCRQVEGFDIQVVEGLGDWFDVWLDLLD